MIRQIFEDVSSDVHGDMNIPQAAGARSSTSATPGTPGFNTLDEPIKDTVVSRILSVWDQKVNKI